MPQQRRIIYVGALPRFGRFCAPHRLYWKVQNLTKHQKEDAYAGTNHTECPDPAFAPDTEHERYHPELEEELKECLFCLKRNEMMFDMEVDTDLIEQRIYERQALLCRYRYLLARARELGLHTVLTRYQPMGG